jgi:hypothetical protein
LRELKQLTNIKSKKIEHPVSGSKDYSDACCRVVWLCYEEYILNTIEGQHILPMRQSLPTLRSVATIYELAKMNQNNPHTAIWGQSRAGEGLFGDGLVVRQNVMPNLKEH